MNSHRPTIALLFMACAVLLIPVIQCSVFLVNIWRLETRIVQTKQQNEDLLQEIGALRSKEATGIAEAARKLGELDGRVTRNEKLHVKTEEADKKLLVVKSLTGEYRSIVRQLDQLKQRLPELSSGL